MHSLLTVASRILKSLRLKLIEDCHLFDDEVYLDCENLLKVPGTKIQGPRVLNDNWDQFYKTVWSLNSFIGIES